MYLDVYVCACACACVCMDAFHGGINTIIIFIHCFVDKYCDFTSFVPCIVSTCDS